MPRYKLFLTVQDSFGKTKEVEAGIVDAVEYELTEVELERIAEALQIKEFLNKAEFTEKLDDRLNCYAKKEEIPDISNLITMQDVENKNYLTEVPSSFATKEFVTEKITEAKLADPDIDLEAYYTKSEVNALIPDTSKFISKIPAEYVTETELDKKGYLTEHQSLEAYAKKDELFSKSYNDLTDKPRIPSIEGLATEEFVRTEIEKIDVPVIDTTNLITTEKLANELVVKADKVPFTFAKFVTKPFGNFAYGENIKGLSVTTILAKLLGLVDKDPNAQEPDGIIESIVKNEIPMYAVTAGGALEEVPYKLLTLTEEEAAAVATESGFYQISDAEGNVIESGYQELQAKNDEVYYIIALPKDIDYNIMISVKAWDTLKSQWTDTGSDKPAFTSDTTTVAALCDEAGIDISHIDTNIYTVWASGESKDMPNGSIYRFVINE